MAYDEHLADRVRQIFAELNVTAEEKKMMCGLCFTVNDKICAGVSGERLMARIDPMPSHFITAVSFTFRMSRDRNSAGGSSCRSTVSSIRKTIWTFPKC